MICLIWAGTPKTRGHRMTYKARNEETVTHMILTATATRDCYSTGRESRRRGRCALRYHAVQGSVRGTPWKSSDRPFYPHPPGVAGMIPTTFGKSSSVKARPTLTLSSASGSSSQHAHASHSRAPRSDVYGENRWIAPCWNSLTRVSKKSPAASIHRAASSTKTGRHSPFPG